jgi:NitT/TauT family transport system substrate-binding protein
VTQDLPILRAGFEGSGSPRWLMRTMQTNGFDRSRGFALDLILLAENANRHGTLQALAERRVDLVDADRQALAAAQADGLPLVAIAPYGRILGSVVVHRDYRSPTGHDNGLAALRGARLGVLSTQDKNWHLLADACRQLAAFPLATATAVITYQRRSELVAALAAGAIDAALVHWHLVPPLVASGHRVLAELPELADALAAAAPSQPNPPGRLNTAAGADSRRATTASAAPHAEADLATTATTFFVVHQELAQKQPALIAAFVAATTDAVSRLRDEASAWQALADDGAVDASHLAALRVRWLGRVGAFHPLSTNSTLRSTPCNPF